MRQPTPGSSPGPALMSKTNSRMAKLARRTAKALKRYRNAPVIPDRGVKNKYGAYAPFMPVTPAEHEEIGTGLGTCEATNG